MGVAAVTLEREPQPEGEGQERRVPLHLSRLGQALTTRLLRSYGQRCTARAKYQEALQVAVDQRGWIVSRHELHVQGPWTYPAFVESVGLRDSCPLNHLLSNSAGNSYPRAECRRRRL